MSNFSYAQSVVKQTSEITLRKIVFITTFLTKIQNTIKNIIFTYSYEKDSNFLYYSCFCSY